jgi:hypothetical protein
VTDRTIALVVRDLLFGSRIAAVVEASGARLLRVDDPGQLPQAASVELVLVDWGERGPLWGRNLREWRDGVGLAERPTIILFGPHTDLEAHADARAAGLGPMLARSRLLEHVAARIASPEPDALTH